MNRRIVAELTKIMAFYPSTKVNEKTVVAYAEYLDDLPEELVLQAIRQCAKSSTFFPALAEIRQMVVTIAGEGVLTPPETAWGEVMREVRRMGYQRRMQGEAFRFSSPLIEQAVESIGWRDICLSETDDLPTIRAQFRNALASIQRLETERIVSGRHPSVAALSDGAASVKRDGLKPIGELVELNDRRSS